MVTEENGDPEEGEGRGVAIGHLYMLNPLIKQDDVQELKDKFSKRNAGGWVFRKMKDDYRWVVQTNRVVYKHHVVALVNDIKRFRYTMHINTGTHGSLGGWHSYNICDHPDFEVTSLLK